MELWPLLRARAATTSRILKMPAIRGKEKSQVDHVADRMLKARTPALRAKKEKAKTRVEALMATRVVQAALRLVLIVKAVEVLELLGSRATQAALRLVLVATVPVILDRLGTSLSLRAWAMASGRPRHWLADRT